MGCEIVQRVHKFCEIAKFLFRDAFGLIPRPEGLPQLVTIDINECIRFNDTILFKASLTEPKNYKGREATLRVIIGEFPEYYGLSVRKDESVKLSGNCRMSFDESGNVYTAITLWLNETKCEGLLKLTQNFDLLRSELLGVNGDSPVKCQVDFSLLSPPDRYNLPGNTIQFIESVSFRPFYKAEEYDRNLLLH